jgi:mRNA-degrading endonuclease RelE of RelBE toxin-antitoxin system
MANQHLNQTNLQEDPLVKKILARIPTQTAATFTDVQLAELKRVFKERVNKKSAVDMRLSIPFFKRRFYLVLLMGKENRSLQRLKNSDFQIVNSFLSVIYALAIISSFLGALFYIEKELQIDAFPYNQIQKVIDPATDKP